MTSAITAKCFSGIHRKLSKHPCLLPLWSLQFVRSAYRQPTAHYISKQERDECKRATQILPAYAVPNPFPYVLFTYITGIFVETRQQIFLSRSNCSGIHPRQKRTISMGVDAAEGRNSVSIIPIPPRGNSSGNLVSGWQGQFLRHVLQLLNHPTRTMKYSSSPSCSRSARSARMRGEYRPRKGDSWNHEHHEPATTTAAIFAVKTALKYARPLASIPFHVRGPSQ